MTKTILATGAAGYVGSHCVLRLLESGYEIIALDNLSNSVSSEPKSNVLPVSLERVEKLTGKKVSAFYNVDLRNAESLENVFNKHKIDLVIHFAALKAVGESVKEPLKYYHNNITGAVILFEVMKKYGVKNFVFSSSATVYGEPQYLPIDEKHSIGVGITNPYGFTKFVVEQMMKDLDKSEPNLSLVTLRYFNPIGNHESGDIGEDPLDIPNNLMPFVAQVAIGRRSHLNVFGDDYDTIDGTGMRDYIHVMDLAEGHVKAVEKILNTNLKGFVAYNLGTGEATSVLQMVKYYETVSGVKVPYKIIERRDGDLPTIYASNSKAVEELNWQPKYTVLDACKHSWQWQNKNPKGFL